MSLHDTLTANPALVDELLRDLNSYALQAKGFHSLPLGKTRDMDALRSLVLAWVARLEAKNL